jgi:eukaryotic-like serine/threonine-protein kinase
MVGTTLNHYRIEYSLGRGGMGEVYAAEDTKLHRRVALKVLPNAAGDDAERRQRFEREAQTVAALNHPNIVTIHSVEQANGVRFLTMELVDGKTLADVIPRDGLQLAPFLQHAVPLADAVSAAHTRGVVHRDLKPANVMVTTDGRLKVLDFGLAKLKEPVVMGNLTTMPAQELTGEGRILGTVAYMAPEQAEGREIDHRSDIFSLGVLLYEMATGERPFKGETSVSLLSAIIKDTPRPITEIKPALPLELGRIVRRCLAKDPTRRYQSALDLRNELEEIKHELDSGELTAAVVEGRRTESTRRRRAIWTGAGVIGLAAAIGLGYLAWRQAFDRPVSRAERFQLQPPSGIAIAEAAAASVLAISPDGNWIAFVGSGNPAGPRGGLFLRSTRELEARRIGIGGSPFFSPDSKWLGFLADNAIRKIPVDGGQPQLICQAPRVRGASWGDDGTILFSAGDGLLRVSSDGGEPETLTTPGPGERHYWPQVLPGGDAAVFTVHKGNGDRWRNIAVLLLKTREIRSFPSLSGSFPRYLRSGHLVFSRSGTIHRVGFDPARLEVNGEPREVLDDVYFYQGSGNTAFDVARSGALVYIPGAERVEETELVLLDRQGAVEPIGGRGPYLGAVVSPDGSRVVLNMATSLEDADLWLTDVARGSRIRLTHGMATIGAGGSAFVWSADGKWVIFTSFRSGHGNLFRIPADGGTPERLTSDVAWDYPGSVSPDGSTLLFSRQAQASQWDLMTLRLEHGRAPQPFVSTPFTEWWPTFSPDGRWIAYGSTETGNAQIHVRPYPGPGARVTVSTTGGSRPLWSRDGRELFYRRSREVWSTAIAAGAAFTHSPPRLLFKADFLPADPFNAGLSLAPDGKRFLAVRPPPRERIDRLLVYVPDWIEEVRRPPAKK